MAFLEKIDVNKKKKKYEIQSLIETVRTNFEFF